MTGVEATLNRENCLKCANGAEIENVARSNCGQCPDGVTEPNVNMSNCPICIGDDQYMTPNGCYVCQDQTMVADQDHCVRCLDGKEADATR